MTNKNKFSSTLTTLILVLISHSSSAQDTDLKTRSFEFEYAVTIADAPQGSIVKAWFPVAESNGQQEILAQQASTPGPWQINRDATYNNAIGFFEVKPTVTGDIGFSVKYDVVRTEAKLDGAERALSEQRKQLFLSPNTLVPIDGRPQELIKGVEFPQDPLAVGKKLYDVVEDHMKYDKSKPGYGNGDAVWACDSQTGNCTDFHSLFISLARSQSIPAQFEIGFPLPSDQQAGKIGGYHCWAWFYVEGDGWLPVDISEADKHPELRNYYFGKLTADRISFSNGRDIELVPASEGGPLNYLIYPYVEVDGKPWPQEKLQLNFSFQDKPKKRSL